jgi:hypothetical protein
VIFRVLWHIVWIMLACVAGLNLGYVASGQWVYAPFAVMWIALLIRHIRVGIKGVGDGQ